jgi:DNA invertase Pin-like site-specific DNA recombinase
VTTQGKRAGIYLRKSSDREGSALGIQRQEEDTRAECARLGAVIVDVYADNDISASTRSRKRRPQYERMLADVDAGRLDMIVAYSTSRLTRRPMEFERLIQLAESGLRIIVTKSGDLDLNTARGRRRARDDAARDCEYAEELSELAKRERQQRRERGGWNGSPRPTGWESDGITPRPVEQQLIADAAAAVLAGRSLGSIARHWTAVLGGSPHGRAKCRPSTVRDILASPRVAGLMPDEKTPSSWAAIIDEDTWRGVRAILADPSRRKERGATRLLTGIALCGVCDNGTTLHGGTARTGEGTYRCSAVAHLDRRAEPVDAFVADVVIAYLARERVAPADPDTGGGLAQDAAALRARLGELADLVADGAMTAAEYRPRADRLRRDLDQVETRMTASLHNAAIATLPADADKLRAAWDAHADDPEWRRSVLRATPIIVTIDPPGRGIRAFDPATVRIDWR